ncbi:MAG: hypothetical protein KA750_10185 [Thermoflexales bacterium]|jgi:hypothetical protein|nr:hypothetical protein [Thermoflexales bacterium]MBP8241697.1 hypothetical protein [Thermoflexales bacterium]
MTDSNDRYPARQALEDTNSSTKAIPWVSLPLANAVVAHGATGLPDGTEQASTEDETLAIDLPLLAERILALMRREAIIDRERSGWMR